jgi:pilus assembly protein CpaC
MERVSNIEGGVMKNIKVMYILAILIILISFSISLAAIPVEVTVGKETVLKINKPITSIKRLSLANEDIAEMKPLIATSPNEVEIIINGKKPGVTSLIVWDTEGKTFFDVIVLEKLDRGITYEDKIRALRNDIKALAPNDDIRVSLANDTILLSGEAANQETINKALQMAQTYAIASDTVTSTRYSAGVTTTETTSSGKVLNHIRIKEAQQVLLEVRVAQIDKTKLKDLGVSVLIKGKDAEGFTNMAGSPSGMLGDGTTFSKTSSSTRGLTSGSSDTSTTTHATTFDNILGQVTSDVVTTVVGSSTSSGNASGNTPVAEKTLSSSITGFDLDTLAPQIGVSHFPGGVSTILKALSNKGLAKILAEPNLIVRSGEKGNFLVGKKVPIEQVYGVGAAAMPTIIFEEVGIRINFAPEVLETGVIRLKIDPAEVSSISQYLNVGSLFAPEIATREVRTSVDLKDGESLILAGLLSEEMIKNMQKIPILGDIPILGALFRSTHEELTKTELAFFITPKLVKPIPPGIKTELPGEKRPTPQEDRELQWIPLSLSSSDDSSQAPAPAPAPAKEKELRESPVK